MGIGKHAVPPRGEGGLVQTDALLLLDAIANASQRYQICLKGCVTFRRKRAGEEQNMSEGNLQDRGRKRRGSVLEVPRKCCDGVEEAFWKHCGIVEVTWKSSGNAVKPLG
ncbi:hypothetical protein DPEC_G00291660 [Dallia pectoralis]|uniref:Uncharacterized protein n=1 Tax=Dallia pectoralis TaxID=75939 RepID=A0ACC2FHU5_DALPE|nr:hypothetical protein DPEC_G00291660 [Dallia pectoralis]